MSNGVFKESLNIIGFAIVGTHPYLLAIMDYYSQGMRCYIILDMVIMYCGSKRRQVSEDVLFVSLYVISLVLV
jgi:hypothetical protein